LVYSSPDLIKLIHETHALSIWNRKKGPVFWYIAGVPGPFYVNTEFVIGAETAKDLLKQIDKVLGSLADPGVRSEALGKIILDATTTNSVYQQVIKTMAAKARENYPVGSYNFISGGERRDWLFSVPLADELNIKHAYLFKNQTAYCPQGLIPHEKALHIADLINNAASYFDLWFPTLEKAKLDYAGTLCFNSRGNGVQKLHARGTKVVALNSIDLGFFEQSRAEKLIDEETLAEIALYFKSPQEWGRQYLPYDVALFEVMGMDNKSFERMRSFFSLDPWSMRQTHEVLFTQVKAAIADRLKHQAA